MPTENGWTFGDVLAVVFSVPVTSLVIVVFLALVCEAWASKAAGGRDTVVPISEVNRRSLRAKYRSAHAMLAAVGLVIIVWCVGEFIVRGYLVIVPEELSWVRFAAPVIGAALGLGLVLLQVAVSGSVAPEAPGSLVPRRTWASFSDRRDLFGAAFVALAFLTTTIAAGMAASADRRGISNTIELPVPNLATVDPIRLPFFGWAYGVPVLVSAGILLLVMAALLHKNASRPFIRPETVIAERIARRQVATGGIRIATAALLLALAASWRLIAGAGSVSGVEIAGENDGRPYEVIWRFAEFASAAGWGAPIAEVVAFTMLLLVVVRYSRDAVWRPPTHDRVLQSEGVR
ncbi:hypothetical protein [Microbacterium phyllosphaerae]